MLFFTRNFGTAFLWIACILAVTGCGPNYRLFSKGNIELSARFRQGEPVYRNLDIGTPARPFDENVDALGDIIVELPNGKTIALSDLTVAIVEKTANRIKSLDDVGYDTGWPSGSKDYTIGTRLFIIVNGERILQLSANTVGLTPNEKPPRFGRKKSKTLYAMPFNHEQVLEIFGEPEKVKDEWRK